MMSKIMIGAFVCYVIVLLSTHHVSARPRDGAPFNTLDKNRNFCEINSTVVETCQQCAKLTKSPLVYPMCCYNEEGVFSWCDRYVSYGIH